MENKYVPTIGTHVLFELRENKLPIDKAEVLSSFFESSLVKARATIIAKNVKEYPNGASSGIYFLAESHLSWHSWPEDDYLALDLYTCGNTFDHKIFLAEIKENFFIDYLKVFKRGVPIKYSDSNIGYRIFEDKQWLL